MVQPTFQVREKIRGIEERLRAFGGVTGAQLSGLQILQEISARIPASIVVNVDTLTITTATTDLSGTTASYDDVVKLKDALEASPFFTTVKITNTKTDVGNKIAFKLTITTVKTLDQPS
jgi:general secretion pathway protein L